MKSPHLARDKFRDLRKAVDGLVGRVNGKYGKTDYTPIQYMKKKLSHR